MSGSAPPDAVATPGAAAAGDSGPPAASDAATRVLLAAHLAEGLGAGDPAERAAELGLPQDVQDQELARELTARLAHASCAGLSVAEPVGAEVARSEPPRPEQRVSYLMRLEGGASEPAVDLQQLTDLRTLQAVMLAGDLRQRRAATLRMGEVLSEPKGQSGERIKAATDFLLHLRKWDLAHELSEACARLPGADGRRARAGRKEWMRLVGECEKGVVRFWDGTGNDEPFRALHGDQRAQMLARVRDLSPVLIRHLRAIIEGTDGLADGRGRLQIVLALRNAADARLLPSLRAVMMGSDAELAMAAARALARVDDPRTEPALATTYERALGAEQRLALAGALGMAGDGRGLEYVREVLAEDDVEMLPHALEALRSLGTSDDVQRTTDLLEHADHTVATDAVKTLGRIGDGRALLPLSKLAGQTTRSALRAEIEETETAVHARMELLGEEAPSVEDAEVTFDTTKMAALAKRRYPATVRASARWCIFAAYLWRAVGATTKAIGRFEQAAALRPDWVVPVLCVAMVHAHREDHAQALAAFRRALEIDRDHVEHHPAELRTLAQAFLRRAEAVEGNGRADIARGLLEEALALDLRKAPSGLRFALAQRHDALKGTQ